jgi:hypothetical protein
MEKDSIMGDLSKEELGELLKETDVVREVRRSVWTEEECASIDRDVETRFAGITSLTKHLNNFIKNGVPVDVLEADDQGNGCVGMIIFSIDENGKETAIHPRFQFRPKVKETVRCKTKSEYLKYKEDALSHKWIVTPFDMPRSLMSGYAVQNSDGVIHYTISIKDYVAGL